MVRVLTPNQLMPLAGRYTEDFEESGHTPKYPDGATAEYQHGPWTIRRYNPHGFWRVHAYEGGSIPKQMGGVYTDIEAFKRSADTFEASLTKSSK